MSQVQLPEPNLPLLRKCVEWAIAESKKPVLESEWDQRWFRLVHPGCKTAYCIAGYACEVSGGQWHPRLLSYLIADNNDNHNDVWIDRNIISQVIVHGICLA